MCDWFLFIFRMSQDLRRHTLTRVVFFISQPFHCSQNWKDNQWRMIIISINIINLRVRQQHAKRSTKEQRNEQKEARQREISKEEKKMKQRGTIKHEQELEYQHEKRKSWKKQVYDKLTNKAKTQETTGTHGDGSIMTNRFPWCEATERIMNEAKETKNFFHEYSGLCLGALW